jgi:HSP20 family protein
MTRDFIRVMHALFLPGLESAPWSPAADVLRLADGTWRVKFDLAGVRPADIDLEVQGHHLTLRGTRRDDICAAGCLHFQLEISYSRFERTLELPVSLDQADVQTAYRDGLLLVTIRPERTEEGRR